MNMQKRDLRPYTRYLIGLSKKLVFVKGIMKLRVTFGTLPLVISMDIDFLLVNTLNMMYNAILGITLLNKVKVIISTPHLLMKFQKPCGVD